jgi:general secretion pathway protein H
MRNRGFSLIELVVVLILISLSTALVIPSLSRFSRTLELKGAVKKVSAILRYFRSEAVNQGEVYQVLFDPNLEQVRVQSLSGEKNVKKAYPLPGGIQMKEVKIAESLYPSDLPSIEFYPNGGSNGGSVLMNSEGRKGYRIKVHFLTGVVEVESVESMGG